MRASTYSYPIMAGLKNKYPTMSDIDSIISIEISNKNNDRIGYEMVEKFIMHRSCGFDNSRSPCMLKGYCSKYFF